MANVFKDISQFTLKSAATGTEEFQVSATEKVTAQQIADLASSGLKVYTITSSEMSNMQIEAAHINELKEADAILVGDDSSSTALLKASGDDTMVAFITGVIPINSEGQLGIDADQSPSFSEINTILLTVDLTTRNIAIVPYVILKKEWLQTSNIIEVGDFTTINEIWPTKTVPGTMCPFYTGSEVYSAPDATETKYVGFVILDSDFATQGGATVVAIAQTSGRQYIGKLDFNGQSIDWCATVNNPVTVTDFKSLPNFVKTAKDGEIIPIIAPASASNGPTGLVSLGPAYGYVQVAKTGSTKVYNFLVQMDSAGNGPRMYTGFVHTAANLIYWLPLNSEESSTIAPVSITEYGDIYGTTAIGENPAGTIVPWYAQGTNVDGDMGPFGGEASRVDGIYITVEGDNGSNNGRSGYLVAYGADHEGMAYCQVSGTADNGGGVVNTSDWVVLKPSSEQGIEKLSTWAEQGTEVAPHINIGFGEVQVPLNRALKESDILRIDFMRRSEASTFYMQGVAIVHVGAVDNSIQGYAAALDEQYVDYGIGEYAALALDANTKLIGHNYFNLYIDTNGSIPQDDYYIMGVYNISGQ